MIKYIINIVILAIGLSQNAFAAHGNLFHIHEFGTILEAPATVNICANIKGPISCQKYIVNHAGLGITTTTNHT